MTVIEKGIQVARQFFKPKLIEHVPGEKRVYQNILGTRTAYCTSEIPFQWYNGQGRPVFTESGTENCFVRVKSYLFGLIRKNMFKEDFLKILNHEFRIDGRVIGGGINRHDRAKVIANNLDTMQKRYMA